MPGTHTDIHMCVEDEAETWPLGILKSLNPGFYRLLFICSLSFSRVLPVGLAYAGPGLCRCRDSAVKQTVLVLVSSFHQSRQSLPHIQPEHLATCPQCPSWLPAPFAGPLRALPGPHFASSLATSGERPSVSALLQQKFVFYL